MRVYYFPDWVFSALSAQGKNRSDVLRGDVVTSILSLDDVAFVSVMNQSMNQVLPKSIVETFMKDYGGPSTFWPPCEFGEGKGARRPIDGLWDRIQNIYANGEPEEWKPSVSNLSCEMMDEDTLVFTNILPITSQTRDGIGVASLEGKLTLLERVIDEVYPFVTFEDLSKTPLMRDFLTSKMLEQKPVMSAVA